MMDINIIRTDCKDKRFNSLVALLDQDLKGRYGAVQDQYSESNQLTHIEDVVLLETKGQAVGCGAIKAVNPRQVEIKRVFVDADHRRKGYGLVIIDALEKLALHKGYASIILETGQKQKAAINLYESMGYKKIPNYGPYVGNDNSICFEKVLSMEI